MRRNAPYCAALALVLLGLGCASSEEKNRRAALARGDLMPAGDIGVEVAYVVDQGTVSLLPKRNDIRYEPLETFRKERAEAAAKAAESGETDGEAAEGEGDETADKSAEKPDLISRLAKVLPGGKDGEKEAAAAPKVNLVDAKPAVEEIPAHPGGKTGAAVNQARDNAVADARVNLIKAILAAPADPSQSIAEALGDDAGSVELELKTLRVTAMKWKNAQELEVDVQITVGDIAPELTEKFKERLDLPELKTLDAAKAFTAKGVGKFEEKDSGVTRMGPGENAKRASESGF